MHTTYYQYIVLPNGFSPVVRAFTKVLLPSFKYLRSKKHLSVRYIDESLLLGQNFEIYFKNIIATVAHLRELAFITHQEKSFSIPTQQIIFLGFVIDSAKIIIPLTEERKRSINMFCENSLSNYQTTIRELVQTIRGIVPSFIAVPYRQNVLEEIGKLHSTALGIDIVAILTGKLTPQRTQQIN